jgi:hypothetical protein
MPVSGTLCALILGAAGLASLPGRQTEEPGGLANWDCSPSRETIQQPAPDYSPYAESYNSGVPKTVVQSGQNT